MKYEFELHLYSDMIAKKKGGRMEGGNTTITKKVPNRITLKYVNNLKCNK